MAGPVRPVVTGQSQQPRTMVRPPAPQRVKAPAAPRRPDSLSAPILPGSSISRRQFNQLVQAAVNTKYGPQERVIQAAQQQNTQLGHDMSGWYDEYRKALQGYRDEANARATATNTQFGNMVNSIHAIDQQTAQNTSGPAGAQAGSQAAQDIANAALVRQRLQGSQGALLASQGQNAFLRAANQADVVAPIQKLQALVGNSKQGQKLMDDLAALKSQEGTYATAAGQTIRQQEATNLLNQAVQQRLGYSAALSAQNQQATHQETVRHNKAEEGIQQQRATTQQYRATHPAAAKPKVVKPVSGPGSLSPAQEAKVIDQIHQVVSVVQRGSGKHDDHEMRQLLATKNNPLGKVIDPRVVNIAFDILRRGGLSPANVTAAHDLGIHISGHFHVLSPKELAATAAPQPPAPAPAVAPIGFGGMAVG